MTQPALLVLSFGGPEGPGDVLPFLENVTRGRNVPHERLLEVAEHYHHFGGVSPINAQNRALIEKVQGEFKARGKDVPVYFGNRNWSPFLKDTLAQMHSDGVTEAQVFVTSAFSSYSGCRQYREDLEKAKEAIAQSLGTSPTLTKIPVYFDHPKFLSAALSRIDSFSEALKDPNAELIFTAHSIPSAWSSSCGYEKQLNWAAGWLCDQMSQRIGRTISHQLVFQSRSGPPAVPWLGPDINDFVKAQPKGKSLVVFPLGFVSDHLEVVWDLDEEASKIAAENGVTFHRVPTVGTHPDFVSMIADLWAEPGLPKVALGDQLCSPTCCVVPLRRPGS